MKQKIRIKISFQLSISCRSDHCCCIPRKFSYNLMRSGKRIFSCTQNKAWGTVLSPISTILSISTQKNLIQPVRSTWNKNFRHSMSRWRGADFHPEQCRKSSWCGFFLPWIGWTLERRHGHSCPVKRYRHWITWKECYQPPRAMWRNFRMPFWQRVMMSREDV